MTEHHWFIHSPTDGHLAYSQSGTITNTTAVNTHVHISVLVHMLSSLLGQYPEWNSWIIWQACVLSMAILRNLPCGFQSIKVYKVKVYTDHMGTGVTHTHP